MTNNQNQRGFIGLFGLLITAAIMVWLAVQILTKLYGPPPANAPAANSIEQGRSIIDSAEEAKRAIEQRNGI